MKQVFRRVIDRRGRVVVLELPEPHLGPDQVLVQSQFSLISSGTETTTLSKTPVELAKQTVAGSLDAKRREADRLRGGGHPNRPSRVARDDHAPRDRLQRRRHGSGARRGRRRIQDRADGGVRGDRSCGAGGTHDQSRCGGPRIPSIRGTPRSSPSGDRDAVACAGPSCSSAKSSPSTAWASSASCAHASRCAGGLRRHRRRHQSAGQRARSRRRVSRWSSTRRDPGVEAADPRLHRTSTASTPRSSAPAPARRRSSTHRWRSRAARAASCSSAT